MSRQAIRGCCGQQRPEASREADQRDCAAELPPPNRKRCGLCARSVIALPALSICRVAVAVILLTPIVISSVRLSRLSISLRADAVASFALLMVSRALIMMESTLSVLRASEALKEAMSVIA